MFISEWQWDDGNLSELAFHGCSMQIIEQVWLEQPRFRRNKRQRAATHQMIGPDVGSTFWVICIVQSAFESGLWRAVTGWRAEPQDIDWYHQRSRS